MYNPMRRSCIKREREKQSGLRAKRLRRVQTRAQRQVLALDLLHRQLPYRVLSGRKMPLIDTRLVGVIAGDTKGGEQSAEFEERRLLPGAQDVGEHAARTMIERLPQPPGPLFGTDETPHFIEFGGASRHGAAG